MMCQCPSDKDYKPHAGCVLQHLGQNFLMANVAGSRISSINQQISTETHSSNNILCDRKQHNPETSSELPVNKTSEQIVSPALNCTAFQPLADVKSRMPSNTQHILKQEQDINLTNINSYICETNSRSLTPREVFQHNSLVGWNEWSIHKRNVYDNGKVNDILFRFLVNTSKTRTDQQHVDTNLDPAYPNRHPCRSRPDFNLESSAVWNTDVMQVLLSELDPVAVETCARLCRVGTLVQHTEAKYFEDLHYDIERLLNDLTRESCEGILSVYTKDYMHLLQRWVKTCRSLHLNPRHLVGDLNKCFFPLPEDIKKNPECLRSWVENWESFDCCIPVSGAWIVIDTDKVDLGNTHEIYISTLRSHVDLSPFDTTVDGEVAWQVIPGDIFANDIMTAEQKLTESERINCKHFLDPGRMEKRRQHILQYFIDKYKYKTEHVKHFLNWADTMKHGEERFIQLFNSL